MPLHATLVTAASVTRLRPLGFGLAIIQGLLVLSACGARPDAAASPPQPATRTPAAVPAPLSLVTFTPANTWSYHDWKDKIAVHDGKVVLAGLTSKGILTGAMKQDLTSYADRSPALRVRVLPGNTAHGLGFRLLDAHNNNAGWVYTLPPPGDSAQLLLPLSALPLSQPNLIERGKDSYVLDQITGWKLAGDWQPGTLAVEIEEVVLVAPDAAMLAQRAAAVAKAKH